MLQKTLGGTAHVYRDTWGYQKHTCPFGGRMLSGATLSEAWPLWTPLDPGLNS